MNRPFLLTVLLAAVLLTACQRQQSEDAGLSAAYDQTLDYATEEAPVAESPYEGGNALLNGKSATPPLSTKVDSTKKIIRNGSMQVQCTDIRKSKTSLDSMLLNFDAYYASELLENNEYRTTYTLSVRVPAQYFDALVARIEKGEDEISGKSITASDVTEEYMDLEMRLGSRRQYLERYRQLLSRASSVKDLIEIEEGIRKLQEEIESAEGRLKYLQDQVNYSTLDLSLSQEKEYVYKPAVKDPFSERAKRSLGAGWKSTINFTLYLISAWPSILLLAILAFVILWWRRRRKSRSQG
jgi:hypothetical protein